MIALEHASVKYGHALALEDISIEVGLHEIVAIVGRNGAGKSTTLKTLVGLLPLVAGRRVFGERDISRLSVEQIARLGIALVPDTRRIFPNLSVRENLRIGAVAHQPGYWTEERVLEIFPRLGERIDFGGDQLSGGEQQMLAISRAIMARPTLLLLDEPSLGLAPIIIQQIFSIIEKINADGTTVFLVEQNANQALRIANRAYVMENGRIVMEDSADKLLTDPAVQKAYLGM